MTQKTITNRFKGDIAIWIVISVLCVFSVLVVYSGIAKRAEISREHIYLWRQIFIIGGGLILMWLVHLVKWHNFLKKAGIIFLIVSWILLIITMLFGEKVGGARRWIDIGIFWVQTSDVAKLALIIYLSAALANIKKFENDFKQMLIWVYAPILITCALIVKDDNSTAMLLFVVAVMMMFFARVPMKKLFTLIGICIAGAALFFLILILTGSGGRMDTATSRISQFFTEERKPDDQEFKAKLAVAEGGIVGKMPGKSEQRFNLPNIESDYIFAIVVEEYGLIGALIIIGSFLILTFRGIRIALKSSRRSSALLVLGITFVYVIQAFINIGVSVDLLPVTGQPMPFVSKGGSMLIVCCIAFGLVLSESRVNAEEKMAEEKAAEKQIAKEKIDEEEIAKEEVAEEELEIIETENV